MKQSISMFNYFIAILLFSTISTLSCKKDAPNTNTTTKTPVLVDPTNADLSNITETTATINASVSSEGGSPLIAKGVCWSTSQNPTINDNKTVNRMSGTNITHSITDVTDNVNFTATLTGLLPQTTYYLRIYGTNSYGTSYSSQISFRTDGSDTTLTDIDGNVYRTIVIGTQTWMAENLKTTKYNDGTTIPYVTDSAQWQNLTTGAYCFYNNNTNNKSIYGCLYNFNAVATNKLAPTGWHIPSDAEWQTLIDYLGGESVAGGKLKSISNLWNVANACTTNSSGFSGLPGGFRGNNFLGGTYDGDWWSTTSTSNGIAAGTLILFDNCDVQLTYTVKRGGVSVRCIKD